MCFDNDDNFILQDFFLFGEIKSKKKKNKWRINVGLAPENKEKENRKE